MKKYKTINKQPDYNIFKIKKINLPIEGNILLMTSSENNNTFIITDSNLFYVIEKGIPKNAKKYKISLSYKKSKKSQTEDKESQIWCDKLGNHLIVKYKNNLYYYNPHIPKDKFQEINLFYNNYYLQPYAIAFNNDYYDTIDTGDFLFSDINSVIYKIRIQVKEKNKIISYFFPIFSFNPINFQIINQDEGEGDEDDEEDMFSDLNYFKLDKNEKILDMKINFTVQNNDIYDNINNAPKNILILAITKNKIFQFYGKDTFEKVFENYTIENGNILKAYKLFHNKKNFIFEKSRIQLFNQYLPFYKFETFQKSELLLSCMFQSGYCIARYEDLLNPTPTKQFIIYDYPKTQQKNSFPIMVCQSLIHIFFLYDDCLIIKNKMTNRIASTMKLLEKYIDMYYNLVMNEIILYSPNNIYKIPLDIETKYIWEYYVEIGNYKFALQTLTKEDNYMKPILQKLYGNLLFEQKKYLEAAEHYAFSDENFEHICLKFLNINNIGALLKYLSLIFHFKTEKKNSIKGKKCDVNEIKEEKYFIEKYLINTWIFELLIIKKEENKKEEIIPFIRDYTRNNIHGKDYIDKNILYFVFNSYGSFEELIEYAKINQDYESVIFNLINCGKAIEALEYIKIFFYFGIENVDIIMRKMFYKYGAVFMKQNPNETINLLDEHFNNCNNHQKEINKILLSYNFNKINFKEENIIAIIKYIKKLILCRNGPNKNKENKKETNNLYNILILFLSLITPKQNRLDSFNELEDLLNIGQQKIYFDLNFSKIIFKNNKIALSYIYYLYGEYNQFIAISLDNNLKNILKIVLDNIENKNLKKQIIHIIINYKKRNKLNEFKEFVDENEDTDTLQPLNAFTLAITDNLKINIFNDDVLENSIINILLS